MESGFGRHFGFGKAESSGKRAKKGGPRPRKGKGGRLGGPDHEGRCLTKRPLNNSGSGLQSGEGENKLEGTLLPGERNFATANPESGEAGPSQTRSGVTGKLPLNGEQGQEDTEVYSRKNNDNCRRGGKEGLLV